MNTTAPFSESLCRLLAQPTRGVNGLVDDLLIVCLKHGLHLDWQAGHCRVRAIGGNWEELSVVHIRKSVFRAILARLAVLCNERTSPSVSPYGGQAELSAGGTAGSLIRVAFVNTPAVQQLELIPLFPEPSAPRSEKGNVTATEREVSSSPQGHQDPPNDAAATLNRTQGR